MTVLAAMQSAAIKLIGQKPQVFFTSSDVFEMEIVDILNEVAKDICKANDWQALTKIETYTGDGVIDNFPFPDDYDRQLINSNLQDLDNWAWNYQHITDLNQFMFIKGRGFQQFPGSWTIYDNKFQFTPPPPAAQSASFPYISKNYAIQQSGARADSFQNDTDEFIIRGGEELLTLGIVWRLRENKKLDYTGDQEAFAMLLEQLSAKDKGSSIIRKGRRFVGLNVMAAWPWTLG
jgi:hypothetical protein